MEQNQRSGRKLKYNVKTKPLSFRVPEEQILAIKAQVEALLIEHQEGHFTGEQIELASNAQQVKAAWEELQSLQRTYVKISKNSRSNDRKMKSISERMEEVQNIYLSSLVKLGYSNIKSVENAGHEENK